MGSTLGVIRGNVRRNLGEQTANFFNNQELNQFIGEGYKHFYQLAIFNGEGYYETSVNINLVANQSLYSVAAFNPPFFALSALEIRVESLGPGSSIPLMQNERRFKPNFANAALTGFGYRPTYKMQGLNIVLEPAPAFSQTNALKCDYIYVPDFPISTSLDAFTFDANFQIVWEPLVELWSTVAALESKDGMGGVSDIQSFRNRLTIGTEAYINSLQRYEYPDSVEYYGLNYANLNGWF